MTDRHAGYIVVLDRDMREDDAQDLIKAISLLRGVAAVTPHIASPDLAIATLRAHRVIEAKLYAALEPPK